MKVTLPECYSLRLRALLAETKSVRRYLDAEAKDQRLVIKVRHLTALENALARVLETK